MLIPIDELTEAERELLAGVPAEAWVLNVEIGHCQRPAGDHIAPIPFEGRPAALCGAELKKRSGGHHPTLAWVLRDNDDYGMCPECWSRLVRIARAALKALGGEEADGG